MIGLKYLYQTLKNGGNLRCKLGTIKQELSYAWQRVWKGYDNRFWWSMDMVFIELYTELFKEFRDNMHSHPHNMGSTEWKNILDKMVNLLEQMDALEIEDYEYAKAMEKKDEFFKLFNKHFYDLWD